jgi:hypothetical protein
MKIIVFSMGNNDEDISAAIFRNDKSYWQESRYQVKL